MNFWFPCERNEPQQIKTVSRVEISSGTRATDVQQVIFSAVAGEVTVIGGQSSNSRKIYQRSSTRLDRGLLAR